jgi:hypothetical protein
VNFSSDFWRHILLGAGGAGALAIFQSLSGDNFGQYNAVAQLGIQTAIELLNQWLGTQKTA